MKKRRILSWILVIAMLITGFALTSCKDDDDDDDDDIEVAEENLSPAFGGEAKRFNGNYTILTKNDTVKGRAFNIVDMVEDDNLGDSVIVTAVQKRNDLIYSNFKTKIKRSPQNNAYDKALEACRSGDDTYDAFYLSVREGLNIALQDYAVELSEHDYIDFSAEWWDQGVYEYLKLAGGMYIAIGDATLVDKDATWGVLFNKQLLGQFGRTDNELYDMVLEGNGVSGGWTLEKMMTLASNMYFTENDTSKNIWEIDYDGVGTYGLFTQQESIIVFLQSGGFTPTKLSDTEITGVVSNMTSEFDEAVEHVWDNHGKYLNSEWFLQLDDVVKLSGTDDGWRDIARGGFKKNKAAFMIHHMGAVDLLRDMEADFGLLPVPKLYDSQTEYANTFQYYSSHCYVVPRRNENKENKSVYILEALAYYSSEEHSDDESLKYAYYDRLLRGKATRDDKSWEMLDLIFENRVYDLALALDANKITDSLYKAAKNPGHCNWQTIKAGEQAGFIPSIAKELETLIQAQ